MLHDGKLKGRFEKIRIRGLKMRKLVQLLIVANHLEFFLWVICNDEKLHRFSLLNISFIFSDPSISHCEA